MFDENGNWAGPGLIGGLPNKYASMGNYGMSGVSPSLAGVASVEPTTMQSLFGYKTPEGMQVNGIANTAISLGSALMNGFLGMQNYGLAKDQFNFQKDAFNKNYAAQKTLTNSSLEDRQRARVASNPTAYQSVGDYMKQNGVA